MLWLARICSKSSGAVQELGDLISGYFLAEFRTFALELVSDSKRNCSRVHGAVPRELGAPVLVVV